MKALDLVLGSVSIALAVMSFAAGAIFGGLFFIVVGVAIFYF